MATSQDDVHKRLSLMKVAELKEMLKQLGMSTGGNKDELIMRLLSAKVSGDEADEQGFEDADGSEIRNGDRAEAAERAEAVRRAEAARSAEAAGRAEAAAPSSTTEVELLRRERDLAEREIQILRREMELMRLSASPPAIRESTVGWKAARDMIACFEGDGRAFQTWEKQVSSIVQTCNLSQLEAKALVCNKLQGKAAR